MASLIPLGGAQDLALARAVQLCLLRALSTGRVDRLQ